MAGLMMCSGYNEKKCYLNCIHKTPHKVISTCSGDWCDEIKSVVFCKPLNCRVGKKYRKLKEGEQIKEKDFFILRKGKCPTYRCFCSTPQYQTNRFLQYYRYV